MKYFNPAAHVEIFRRIAECYFITRGITYSYLGLGLYLDLSLLTCLWFDFCSALILAVGSGSQDVLSIGNFGNGGVLIFVRHGRRTTLTKLVLEVGGFIHWEARAVQAIL